MRKLAIAVALATTAMATPAVAKDHTFYIGGDLGAMIVQDSQVRVFDVFPTPHYAIDHKVGFDVDLLAGYDFGFLRAEAEIAYKRASVNRVTTTLDQNFADGESTAFSGMLNGLVDFGDEDGLYGFAGGGIGVASVKHDVFSENTPEGNLNPFSEIDISDTDSHMAWQLIAGARWALNPNLDVGFKYRYFNVGKLVMTGDFEPGGVQHDVQTHFRSHSLMLSLAYNFYAPPPPPPPPPPAPPPPPPATQTCPDGSVIPATDACPAPPPPPPPPPPAPERGL